MAFDLNLRATGTATADVVLWPPGALTFGAHLYALSVTSDVVLRFEYAVLAIAAAAVPVPVSGAAAISDDHDIVAAVGVQRIPGAAAIVDDHDIVAVVGVQRIPGAATITEANDSISASGTAGTTGTTGRAVITEANDAISAIGTTSNAAPPATSPGAEIYYRPRSRQHAIIPPRPRPREIVTGNARIGEADDHMSAVGQVVYRALPLAAPLAVPPAPILPPVEPARAIAVPAPLVRQLASTPAVIQSRHVARLSFPDDDADILLLVAAADDWQFS